jgi:TetR/AcrR family fatty acid metabolism transcriptional regulator
VRTKTPQQAEKILEAAGRLFAGRRFHEVRMEDVAADAGVSKGTLYRYFHDKQEMYLALLGRASQQYAQELRTRAEQVSGARQKLVAIVGAILAFFDRQPHLLDLIQRAEVQSQQGGDFPWQQARSETLRLVLDIFRQGRLHGEFDVRRPETAVLMLLGGLRAVVRFGPQPHPEGLAQALVDDFLAGAALERIC